MTRKERKLVMAYLAKEQAHFTEGYHMQIGWMHHAAAALRGLSSNSIACSQLETVRRIRPDLFEKFLDTYCRPEEKKKPTNIVQFPNSRRSANAI